MVDHSRFPVRRHFGDTPEDRRFVCQIVVFVLLMIVAGYCGNESRKKRLACIAAGGTEVRDARGQHPYCIPPADSPAP
jgi:hypothetical protein